MANLIAGPVGGLASWLAWGAVGPAAVAIPMNWTAEKLADAAVGWFKRIRKIDDLSCMIKAASGVLVDLNAAEFKNLRKLLEKQETWTSLAQCNVSDLAGKIATCLPARVGGRNEEGSRKSAEAIACGLLEFAVFKLEPETFQKVVLARLQQITDQTSTLGNALYDLHSDLYAFYARVDAATDLLTRVLDRLPSGPADRAEIVVYLTTLVKWLGTDPWPEDRHLHGPTLTPAAIECKLRITATNGAGEVDLDADLLAQRCLRLVILGGPGSGKTWLAKRTARRCAERALDDLVAGEPLEEVELPLYTTCASLFSAAAGNDNIRKAAVSSALSQIGDLGSSRITDALRLSLADRNAHTVLLVDSLDEAQGSTDPLSRADTLCWRIILTSRPSSWNRQLRIDNYNDTHRIGELQPLRYPDDVEPFIQRWFDGQPERGRDLAEQIAQRPDLQQAATVPLILAFYCIIGGDKPMPDRTTRLYELVLTRMLTGRWRGDRVGSDSRPDPTTCRRLLTAWAWSGATNSDPVSGVGTWADDLPTERFQLGEADRQALDHVATPVDYDDSTGETLRRFVHRSIREQLVAKHIAGISVDDARDVLFPHLWYDPDWEYVAPAAIAMHDEHDQLLRVLICRAAGSDQLPADLSVVDAGLEFRRLLARVASQSSETDWSPEVATMIGQARVELAWSAPTDGFGMGAHWETSNHRACTVLLEFMDTQIDQWETSRLTRGIAEFLQELEWSRLGVCRLDLRLVDNLVKLGPSAGEKSQACRTLLRLLRTETSGSVAIEIIDRLVELEPTAEDNQRATTALLRLLPSAISSELDRGFEFARHSDLLGKFLDAIVQVATSEEDNQKARKALLKLLDTGNPRVARPLVSGVVQLATSRKDKLETREALLRLLGAPDNDWVADFLTRGVVRLDPTPLDKQRAREMLLKLLGTQTFWARSYRWAPRLMDWVIEFDPTPEGKQQVREMLLKILDTQTSSDGAESLVDAVVRFDPTLLDKQRAREALLRLLETPDNDREAGELVRGVVGLDPTPLDKQRIREMLPRLLGTQTNCSVAKILIDKGGQLATSEEDKHQLREALLKLLSAQTDNSAARILVETLVDGAFWLATSGEDRQQVREMLLRLLGTQTDSFVAVTLVDGVIRLDPTPQDIQLARDALLRLLDSPDNDRAAEELVRKIARLDPAPLDRQRAREMMLGLLDSPTFWAESYVGAQQLVDWVTTFDPTPGNKQRVREILLSLLGTQTDSGIAGALVDRAVWLSMSVEDKQQVRELLLRLLGTQTDSSVAVTLVDWVIRLDPPPQDTQRARGALLRLLASETDRWADRLVDRMAYLDPTVADLSTWRDWAVAPTTRLLAVTRWNSPLSEWLTALPHLPDTDKTVRYVYVKFCK